MATIKIGIVEDEIVIARTIENTLEELGYEYCGPADSYTDALAMIASEKPDLLLLDVHLSGEKDGIDIAQYVHANYKLPFIFLTAFSDKPTIDRAKLTMPNAYIVKPFTKDELYATIEVALMNYNAPNNVSATSQAQPIVQKEFGFFKDGQNFHKVIYNDIIYLETNGNYTIVRSTNDRKIMVRSTLQELMDSLPAGLFCRTHRSFAINVNKITSIETLDVVMETGKVPLSKSYKEDFLKRIGI
jgi:DNA-binding LytR/AlgR family response regulator